LKANRSSIQVVLWAVGFSEKTNFSYSCGLLFKNRRLSQAGCLPAENWSSLERNGVVTSIEGDRQD
jgi:hypothetical protein